jgi:hypothetical protein
VKQLEQILERLIQSEVEFVVVGGFAAMAHGSPLITQDVDICLRPSGGNWMRLQDALDGLHPVHRMTPDKRALELTVEFCRALKSLYLDTSWGQLDCLSEVDGVGDYEKIVTDSEELELPFGLCRVMSLDALIQSKEAIARPKDILALTHLKAIREAKD